MTLTTGGESEENHVPPNTRTTSAPTQSTDFTIVHPTQVRFTCPVCAVTYPKYASLVRHVGVSHKSVSLNITFKCALCDYTHANKRSTSLHFRHAHGAAIPPATIDGSKEKACPFCPLTFPSSHSCSTHIREKHMSEACQQRTREAAQKEVQQGVSTARTKWTQCEVERFKAALAKYGPASNIKLAKEVYGAGQRLQVQVPQGLPNLVERQLPSGPTCSQRPQFPPLLFSYTEPTQFPGHRRPLSGHQHTPSTHSTGHQGKACRLKGLC